MDIVSKQKRNLMMAGIKGKDTKPEIFIRKLLHTSGFRFRLHDGSLPGKPDIVLKKYRVIVLVDSCFRHGHNGCHFFRLPKSNTTPYEIMQKLDNFILNHNKTPYIEISGATKLG